MQRTDAQRDASRANGARSNGPVTPEGKAASSQNGRTHGLFSTQILLRAENQETWNQLSFDLTQRFNPGDNVELNVIYEMASATWRAQRASALEAALINLEYDVLIVSDDPATSPEDEIRRAAVAYANAVGRNKAILELGRQSVRFNNLWMRLHTKKELQKDRKDQAPPPPDPPPAPSPQKSESEPGNAEPKPVQQDASPKPTPAPASTHEAESRRDFFTRVADLGDWSYPLPRSPLLRKAA